MVRRSERLRKTMASQMSPQNPPAEKRATTEQNATSSKAAPGPSREPEDSKQQPSYERSGLIRYGPLVDPNIDPEPFNRFIQSELDKKKQRSERDEELARNKVPLGHYDFLNDPLAPAYFTSESGFRWASIRDVCERSIGYFRSFGTQGVDDLSVQTWEQAKLVGCSIMELVTNYIRVPQSWDCLSPKLQTMALKIAPLAKEIFVDEWYRECLITALVWRVLDDAVLSRLDGRVECTHPAWRHYSQLVDVMKDSLETRCIDSVIKFHQWRLITASLTKQHSQQHHRLKKESLKDIILEEVPVLVPLDTSENSLRYFNAALNSVLEEVLELDRQMVHYGSDFSFVFSQPETQQLHGFPFKADHLGFKMREATGRSNFTDFDGQLVDLVVSPGFVAYGLNGGRYEKHFCNLPMSVLIDVLNLAEKCEKDEVEEVDEDTSMPEDHLEM